MKLNKNTILFGVLFFFLAGVVYVTATLSTGNTVFFGRASNPGQVSPDACRLFASPVIAKAGGQEKIGITVFVLNGGGLGIPKQLVGLACKDQMLCQNANVAITPMQPNTGEKGDAMFEVTSPVPGTFELQAVVASQTIPQTVTVVFK